MLQLLEQAVAARHLDLAGCFLDVERFHHAVVDHHAVALRAHAEAVAGTVEGEVDRFGELAVAVGEELDLVARIGIALPRAHDEHVVDAGDRDRVDALALDGIGILHDRRHVHLVAGAGVGARHGEQRHFLALEHVVRGFPGGPIRTHDAEFGFRQTIADLDGHGTHPLLRVGTPPAWWYPPYLHYPLPVYPP